MKTLKDNWWVLAAVIVYVLSPVDLAPGPLDDFVAAVAAYFYARRNNQ